MSIQYDIYISHSKNDNFTSSESSKGWASNFQYFLDRVLKQVIGESPVFLQYNNQEKPNDEQLSQVGILICIISPDYVNNTNCVEDILVFCKELEKQGVPIHEIKKRIFNIVKYPVPNEQLPSKIRDLLCYNLYIHNDETGYIQEIKDFFGETENNYWTKLLDLGYDIQDTLLYLKDRDSHESMMKIGTGKAVYLAEASSDLFLQRNIIKRELQKYGYRILPDHNLPSNIREMEAVIRKDLEESQMSIHLIGTTYGEIPNGGNISIIEMQNKFAGERCHLFASMSINENDSGFSRYIWLSPETKLLNDKQIDFIENLKKEVESIERTEMVQTPIEDFKAIIRQQLGVDMRNRNSEVNFTPDLSRKKRNGKVYLIFEKIDRDAIIPIKQFLEDQEIEVFTPDIEGSLIEIQQNHIKNLKNFDVAIIYQGKVNEQWVKMKILDLLKAPGYGRDKPIISKLLIAGKGAKNYDFAEQFDIELIDATQNFEYAALNETLELM